MIQNLVYNLCESFVVNIGGVSGATPHKVAVATPVISLTGNSVTITCDTTGATIYYTLDGSTPTSSSSQYSSAFTLDSSCTIKAIAIKGGKSSAVAEESYVKPITYLTQWKIVGNSEVHTDPYLTSWKVFGNSIVQDGVIMSCGDLGQDGKYHVKISNGVSIADIALTEPLRKVNDVADTIEFPSETEGKALVTRNIASTIISNLNWIFSTASHFFINNVLPIKPISSADVMPNIMIEDFTTYTYNDLRINKHPYGCSFSYGNNMVCLYDESFYEETQITQEFEDYISGKKIIYELATPTTELIDVSQFPVSPTDTYTSANVIPFSAFEHTENKEIWSCGEYNTTDGKYHILVKPQGGSIVDIALPAPLKKVNNIAETIIYPHPSGVSNAAIVSVFFISVSIDKLIVKRIETDRTTDLPIYCRTTFTYSNKGKGYSNAQQANILCNKIKNVLSIQDAMNRNGEFIMVSGRTICVRNTAIEQTVEAYQSYFDSLGAIEIIWPVNTPGSGGVKVSQIQEADSYSCEISQGAKAVSWSSFETE